MLSFTDFISESTKIDHQYLRTVLANYKIPEEFIKYYYVSISISLPTPKDIDKTHPEINKLKKDLRSGLFRPKRLISFEIADTVNIFESGIPSNKIGIEFANEKLLTNPKTLFHWTKKENVSKILETGLKPSSGNWNIGSRGSVAYNGIFLVKKFGSLSKNRGFNQYKRPAYELLKIEIPSGLAIWKDPNRFYPDPESYVVFEEIPKQYISIK